MLLPLIAAVVVVVFVFFTIGDRDAETRATILKGTGFALLTLSTLFFVMFRVADTLHEHDGWAVVGAIAAWAVPMAVLAAIAWLWPDVAIRVIAVLIAATIVLAIWFALDVDGWTAFEDPERPDPRHRDVRPGRGRRGARAQADGGGRSPARDPRRRARRDRGPGQPRGHRAGHRVRDAHRRGDPVPALGEPVGWRGRRRPRAGSPAEAGLTGATLPRPEPLDLVAHHGRKEQEDQAGRREPEAAGRLRVSVRQRRTAGEEAGPDGPPRRPSYRPPVNGASPSRRGRKRRADQTSSTAACPIGRMPYSATIGHSESRLMSERFPFGYAMHSVSAAES